MAPTDGRVAEPERQWGCRRGTPVTHSDHTQPMCPHKSQCRVQWLQQSWLQRTQSL